MGGDHRERTETVARFRDEIAPVPGHARRHVHTLETKVAKQDFDAISRRQYFGRHGLTSVAKSATTRPYPLATALASCSDAPAACRIAAPMRVRRSAWTIGMGFPQKMPARKAGLACCRQAIVSNASDDGKARMSVPVWACNKLESVRFLVLPKNCKRP